MKKRRLSSNGPVGGGSSAKREIREESPVPVPQEEHDDPETPGMICSSDALIPGTVGLTSLIGGL